MKILKMTHHHEKCNGFVGGVCGNVEIEFIMDFMFL